MDCAAKASARGLDFPSFSSERDAPSDHVPLDSQQAFNAMHSDGQSRLEQFYGLQRVRRHAMN